MFGLGTAPLTVLTPNVTVQDLGGGISALIDSNGQVVSCQPNGALDTRPPGSYGAYERCIVKGDCATYNPTGTTGQGYVFALRALPND